MLHFRDSNGHEIDAIVALADGRWGAVEVKLGGRQLAAGAASLATALAQIGTTLTGEPTFRLVVTGTGPIVVTDDGAISAPLHALAPWSTSGRRGQHSHQPRTGTGTHARVR